MLRRRAWGLSAALFTALGGAVVAAGPDDTVKPPDIGNTAFHRWNGGPIERPKPPPLVDKSVQARANDTAAALRAQEDANFLRRMSACDKLRALALQTGDDSLEKLAEELEQKAREAYKKRTSNLASGLGLSEPESRPAVASNAREGKR